MTGIVAFVLPLAAGWCLAAAALSGRSTWAERVIAAALGVGGGVAVCSVAFFLLTICGAASPATILIFEAALLAGSALWQWRTLQRAAASFSSPAPPPTSFRWNWLLALALAGGFAVVLYGLVSASSANPFGEWDAWSIWNLRAKFLAGPGNAWKSALSALPDKAGMHPDYPLLLSGFVGMVWKVSGETAQWVPQVTGFLFLGSVLALLTSALAALRSVTTALLAGFVLLASTSFLYLAPMQYADLPLAFYYLAALALLLVDVPAAATLAGVFASFAAWTKNEGLTFLLALALAVLVFERRRMGRFLAGAAPVLLLVICFKLFLAPASEPLFKQGAGQIAHKLVDFGRYAQIGKALFLEAYHLGQPWSHPLLLLAILAVALRFRPESTATRALRASAIALLLVFAAYCGVYLITPSDLAWHLRTSLPRLYGQLWPSALLLVFLVLNVPAEAAPEKPAHKRKERGRK